MNPNSKRNPLVSCKKKVMPLAAGTFFLCLTSTQAQNIATGDVYGNNINGSSITSIKDGTSDLTVRNPATTQITLDRTVEGFISISNNFNTFDLLATGGTLTGFNTATLSVTGGTNLNLTGGTFSGGSYEIGTNSWIGSEGAILSNVRTSLISEAVFEGKSILDTGSGSGGGPPVPGASTRPNASGSSGLIILNSTSVELTDTTIKGGNAGAANGYGTSILAMGGTGLEIHDSSAVISNVTITGGIGGEATTFGDNLTLASGGHAIYATNAILEVRSGTFSGGAAGTADNSTPVGGAGLIALGGSSITNYGGTFIGSDAPSIYLENSALTTFGGTYNSGGLYSQTTGSGTNHLNLLGGSFSSLTFINETQAGIQFVTTSNTLVAVDVYQDGGTVDVTNLDDNAFQNTIIDSGTMIFNQDLSLGTDAMLRLSSAGSHAEFQGLEIGTNALVDVGTGTIDASGDINVLGGASFNFQIVAATNSGSITTLGGVSFESNTTVKVDASLAGFSTGASTVTVIKAASPIVGSFISDVRLTLNTNAIGRTTVGAPILDNNLSYLFVTLSLSNYWDASGELALLADDLEGLASAEMNAIINNLGSDASKTLVEETYFTTMNTFQVAKQGLDAAVGLALSRGTEFRDQQRLPAGAGGPSSEVNNDWRFWAKYYGQFYHRNREGIAPEYDATMHGGVIGMDKSYGNLLVGLSGGAGKYSIDTEIDSSEDMNAYQAALYSTYGKGYSYIDLGLAYGFNDVESSTASPFILESEFDTQLLSAHLGGGYGFEFPDIGTVFTPEVAVRYTAYEQDAYTESGAIAAPRSFDEFDADSLVGSLGLNASMLNSTVLKTFAFKIDGRAHWIREFNPVPGNLSFQLVGGGNDYLIAYPSLDEDTIRLGFGFTFFNAAKRSKKNILLRLDFDELFGEDFNSHNLSAKAIYAF